MRQGSGSFKFIDNSGYDGEWYQDLKHGQGKFTWEDGSFFVGEFVNGKSAAGILTDPEGKTTKIKV